MSPTRQFVVTQKQLILYAFSGFGAMIATMLATLAITVPVMTAQADSQLDQQAKQFAQVMASYQQPGTLQTTAAPTEVH